VQQQESSKLKLFMRARPCQKHRFAGIIQSANPNSAGMISAVTGDQTACMVVSWLKSLIHQLQTRLEQFGCRAPERHLT
jgi:ubiquinone biosynthesis protein UbiJ